MPNCGHCQENFPAEHLHALAEDGVRQCPACIEDWCEDWREAMPGPVDVIRRRNEASLRRFLEWRNADRHERRGLN